MPSSMEMASGLKFGDYNRINPFNPPRLRPENGGRTQQSAGGSSQRRMAAVMIGAVALVLTVTFVFDFGGMEAWRRTVGGAHEVLRRIKPTEPPTPPPEPQLSKREHLHKLRSLKHKLEQHHKSELQKSKADVEDSLRKEARNVLESKEQEFQEQGEKMAEIAAKLKSEHLSVSEKLAEKEKIAVALAAENKKSKEKIKRMKQQLVRAGQEMLNSVEDTETEEESEVASTEGTMYADPADLVRIPARPPPQRQGRPSIDELTPSPLQDIPDTPEMPEMDDTPPPEMPNVPPARPKRNKYRSAPAIEAAEIPETPESAMPKRTRKKHQSPRSATSKKLESEMAAFFGDDTDRDN